MFKSYFSQVSKNIKKIINLERKAMMLKSTQVKWHNFPQANGFNMVQVNKFILQDMSFSFIKEHGIKVSLMEKARLNTQMVMVTRVNLLTDYLMEPVHLCLKQEI